MAKASIVLTLLGALALTAFAQSKEDYFSSLVSKTNHK
jgi:hypothetical protein